MSNRRRSFRALVRRFRRRFGSPAGYAAAVAGAGDPTLLLAFKTIHKRSEW